MLRKAVLAQGNKHLLVERSWVRDDEGSRAPVAKDSTPFWADSARKLVHEEIKGCLGFHLANCRDGAKIMRLVFDIVA